MAILELSNLRGIGEKRKKILNDAGIFSVQDILNIYPSRYQDWSKVVFLSQLNEHETTVVKVRVVSQPTISFPKRNMSIVQAKVEDESGTMQVRWFNQPYVKNTLQPLKDYVMLCKLSANNRKVIINPVFKKIEDKPLELVPVYPVIQGIPSSVIKDLVKQALSICELKKDIIPDYWKENLGLLEYSQAVIALHMPKTFEQLQRAKDRLAFDEMLVFQAAVELHRKKRQESVSQGLNIDVKDVERKSKSLPYRLTNAQERVVYEVLDDMKKPTSMARMIQGDVGCGKTVIAFLCAYVAVKAGVQVAIMAPTEILAIQHAKNAQDFFKDENIKIEILIGGNENKQKKGKLENIRSGKTNIIIGTHALIQNKVEFCDLGLVIADEQHRFGVMQRSKLQSKGRNCDVLVMSATPIPRSLALILYADMEISVVDESPPGRKSIVTRIVPDKKRNGMYGFIDKQISSGCQAYIICPLVEDSEEIDAVSAQTMFDNLNEEVFKNRNVGLMHGRMTSEQKDRIMNEFIRGEIDILVSTTVVEVGVDVSSATVMVIENADRFGLSQLHQLRGRVGRGKDESFCFLLSNSQGEDAIKRLEIMVKSDNGFDIAKQDLEMRGPGEFLGKRQHGSFPFPGLIASDMRVVKAAREVAKDILSFEKSNQIRGNLIAECKKKYRKFFDNSIFN